jgi:hypothetical protein
MTDFIVSHFIKYGGVFLGGDPAKRDENHKIWSAPSGRDINACALGHYNRHLSYQCFVIDLVKTKAIDWCNFGNHNRSYHSIGFGSTCRTLAHEKQPQTFPAFTQLCGSRRL